MKKPDIVFFIHVLRRRAIPVECFGVSATDARRFIELFCRVWISLSFFVRRTLLAAWRQRRLLVTDYPKIILANRQRWFSQFSKRKNANTPSAFFRLDTGYFFCSDMIMEMDTDGAEALIAHELTHEFQFAIGAFKLSEYDDKKIEVENNCNSWIELFGFDAEKLKHYKKIERKIYE
ncbi:MAG: hypothetical protein FJ263_07140 [Planctomycetes bacterium]|nr:hypothetical protein [Planctomycetota bacterium]